MRILRYFYFLTIFFWFLYALFSCSASKRINRIIDRHPELKQNEVIVIDTVLKALAPSAQVDTFFTTIEIKDTVLFEQGQLSVKLWEVYDTVFIDAKCDTFEILVPFETQVEVEKIIYRKPRDRLICWVLIAVLCLVIYFLAKNRR